MRGASRLHVRACNETQNPKPQKPYIICSPPRRAQVGAETFRLCRELVDGVVLVDNGAISAAIRDVFNETRCILEPAGAVAVAGAKAYLRRNGLQVHARAFTQIVVGTVPLIGAGAKALPVQPQAAGEELRLRRKGSEHSVAVASQGLPAAMACKWTLLGPLRATVVLL